MSRPTPSLPDLSENAPTRAASADSGQIMPSALQWVFPENLPVSARRDDIAAALQAHQVVIVCGETGSGKTTQLPKIALAAGRGCQGLIGMTQPRRIAAKSVAQRIAQETQSELGGLVGWQVRFSDHVSAQSRIKVMTDGILLAETQSDPAFRAYDTLILDEAHERSLNIDFLLGYLKTLLPRRPDLRVVISSATIEAERFSAYFNGAPVVEVSGRTYPVSVRYRPPETGAAEEKKRENASVGSAQGEAEGGFELALLHAVDELAAEGPGDILVFLPGEREIREAMEDLRKHHPPHTEILPLFARLSVGEQERIFAPHAGRRIVLATNVAETSLTVPGIRYVVDAGLARVKRYSLRNKIEQLKIEKISRASANQRTGRCGRVAEGICIRLFDEADFLARPAYTTPELLRASLAGVILRMKSLHLPEVDAFPFLDAPEAKRIHDGRQLLLELGALDEAQRLTAIGKQLARLPLDPRIGRILIAAREKAVLHEALVIAAWLSVQDPRERPLEQQQAADDKHRRFADAHSDFIAILNVWRHIDTLNVHRKSQKKFREALKKDFLSPNRVREWRDVYGQLMVQVKELGWSVSDGWQRDEAGAEPSAAMAVQATRSPAYTQLHQALLPGLLGNLGVLTEEGVYLGAREMKFLPFPGSGVKKKPKWVMAAEIVETRRVYARTVARVEPEWIEMAARPLLKVSYADPHWAKKPAHVSAAMRATLYGLPVVNGRQVHYGPIDPVLSRQLFIRAALVGFEWDCRAPFFAHNQRLVTEIEDLSQRTRNARMAVDEEALYAFFDARVPEGIHNGAAFEKWRREVEKSEPRSLFLSREVLMGEGTCDQARDFPTRLVFNGTQFSLSYCFEPGTDADGVTLHIPLAALNQIVARTCEWLVPGLLEEKLVALLKGLPQGIRRNFIPVPEFARAARESLQPAAGEESAEALTEALGEFLVRRTGQRVPRDAWRSESLPAHLRMNFRVFDEQGTTLAEGRDLALLRARLGDKASEAMARTASSAPVNLERESVSRWDFGVLPESINLNGLHATHSSERASSRGRAGDGLMGGLKAFPALELLATGGVRVTLFDNPVRARHAHALGTARLLWLHFPDLLKQSERTLAANEKAACLQYGLLFKGATGEALIRDVLTATALGELMQAETLPEIRDEAAFLAACHRVRMRLPQAIGLRMTIARDCLAAAQRLRLFMGKASASLKNAVADLDGQLQALVFPGFLLAHPPGVLPHLPRYLKAMEWRCGKLPHNQARDQGSMNEMAALLKAFRQRDDKDGDTPEWRAFRWQLEELRVSLFAQELKTPQPVSVKRLEKRWQEITG